MINLLKFVAAVSFMAVLTSCAAAPHGWYKQGVSEYETENAVAQCEYEQGKDHIAQGSFITSCMKRQGFRWVE